MGWCDDPRSSSYNRAIDTRAPVRQEAMWRADELYDVVFVIDYNIHPRKKGAGSAIFFHLARPGLVPTEGCVAISLTDMRRLIPRLSRRAVIDIRRT